jgi:hypothetical protein
MSFRTTDDQYPALPASSSRQRVTKLTPQLLVWRQISTPEKGLDIEESPVNPYSNNIIAPPVIGNFSRPLVRDPSVSQGLFDDIGSMSPSVTRTPTTSDLGGTAAQVSQERATPEMTEELFEKRSLNLVCYRSSGCVSHQVVVYRKAKRDTEPISTNAFLESVKNDQEDRKKAGITTDEAFMRALWHAYSHNLCRPWRHLLSLKSLRALRLRKFIEQSSTQPTIVEISAIEMQEFLLYIYHPERLAAENTKEGAWIDWVFRLRKEVDGKVERHLLEFVECWDATRIVIASSIPLLGSTVLGLVWAIELGDAQTAFTVASFVLSLGAGESNTLASEAHSFRRIS